MKTSMLPIGSGGGESGGIDLSQIYFSWLAASAVPSWSNTPIPPYKVWLYITSGNSHDVHIITNVNSATRQKDGNYYLSTDRGATWSVYTGRSFVITDTSVALSGSYSSAVQAFTFVIE